jgi:two-component system cell cycle sensor histidine kinase PleC
MPTVFDLSQRNPPRQSLGSEGIPARPAPSPDPILPRRYGTAGREGAKQSFLAAMSHELRTPLNAVIGFAEIMDGQVLGPIEIPQYRQYIRDILESGRHLLRVIEGVLDISNAESGELVLNKREVELRTLIGRAMGETLTLRATRDITVDVAVSDDLILKVDPEKISRAIAALISNAVKFSPDASAIKISSTIDGNLVRIGVTDCGIGIKPLALDRVFLPFVQLEDNLARRFDGSGLGLPLARLFAELHGGALKLDSVPGGGTTATLTLPAYAAAD